MKTINSQKISDTQTTGGYSKIYSGGAGDERVSVSDGRISTEAAARARAYAELLKGGYKKTEATIEVPFDAKVGINSIVRITALRKGILGKFLVKEIDISGDSAKIIMKIKAERYD